MFTSSSYMRKLVIPSRCYHQLKDTWLATIPRYLNRFREATGSSHMRCEYWKSQIVFPCRTGEKVPKRTSLARYESMASILSRMMYQTACGFLSHAMAFFQAQWTLIHLESTTRKQFSHFYSIATSLSLPRCHLRWRTCTSSVFYHTPSLVVDLSFVQKTR